MKIKNVKSRDRNTMTDAVSEIRVLVIFHSEDHPVLPAKLNQAGFESNLIF
jgi:hypothetical protein